MPTEPPNPAPRSADTREIELKLLVDPADLPRVTALPLFAAHGHDGAVTRRQRTVYYDTPDLGLMHRGIALRIRHERGRAVQSLKTLASGTPGDSAGVAVRREWDWPLAGHTPDFAVLDAGGAGPLVPEEMRAALAPIFETDVTRTTLLLRPDPLSAVEVAVDQGVVKREAGSAITTTPISEVELELRAGGVGRLFDLALALNDAVPVRLATVSKAEMGYALVTGSTPGPVQPEPLALSPLTTVAEAFRHIVRHGLRLLLANEACVLAGGDSEGLHQIRVALRRVRVSLTLFGDAVEAPPTLKRELRRLADRLQPARTWDVLLSAGLLPLGGHAHRPEGLAPLTHAIRTLSRPAAEQAVQALSGARTTRLLLTLAAWLEGGHWHTGAAPARRAVLDRPMTELAGAWLTGLHARTVKAAKGVDPATPETVEKLRRRLRRLRTAMDFFRGLYPPDAVRAYARTVDEAMAILDGLHDTGIARGLLGQPGLNTPTHPCRAALDAALRWLAQEEKRRRTALPAHARLLRDAPVFWG